MRLGPGGSVWLVQPAAEVVTPFSDPTKGLLCSEGPTRPWLASMEDGWRRIGRGATIFFSEPLHLSRYNLESVTIRCLNLCAGRVGVEDKCGDWIRGPDQGTICVVQTYLSKHFFRLFSFPGFRIRAHDLGVMSATGSVLFA